MKPTVCICCGERIVQDGNSLSRDPNVCASCSSMADGLDENAGLIEATVSAVAATNVQPQPPSKPPMEWVPRRGAIGDDDELVEFKRAGD